MSTVAWSPKNQNLIAIGSNSNEILLMDITTNVVFKKMHASHGFVTDIRWNPGGEGVILVKHDLTQEVEGGNVFITMHTTEGDSK